MKRRRFIKRVAQTAAVSVGSAIAARPLRAETPTRRSPFGIGMHSYGIAWQAAQEGRAGAKFTGARSFLEYAHRIGAAGVQVVIRPAEREEASVIRARAEELGVFFECQLNVPKDETDRARFETELKTLRAAGATVARTTVLGTRRYESMKTAADWRDFQVGATRSLALAEPVLRKQGVRLAIENHKDFLAPELVELLQKTGSEWIGACVDTGNSLALLEEPYSVVEALAPFAVTSHIKDMAIQEYADGFLLSEVPIGDGFLDLPRMIATLRKAHPRIALHLEMITRDPLRIPCLTPGYWATLAQMKGAPLAGTLALVKNNPPRQPLPRTTGLSPAEQLELEDNHVRQYLNWAREKMG